jgi:mRNA interferase RelE/StbE
MKNYRIFVIPSAWDEIRDLPGNMRQRVRRTIDALEENPRPSESKLLRLPATNSVEQSEVSEAKEVFELRRIRMERWRILYIINDGDETIDVLAVRKRPPYDYGDLSSLLENKP